MKTLLPEATELAGLGNGEPSRKFSWPLVSIGRTGDTWETGLGETCGAPPFSAAREAPASCPRCARTVLRLEMQWNGLKLRIRSRILISKSFQGS
jgi:hypothetical protein